MLKAFDQMLTDLDRWVRRQGLSLSQLKPIYDSVVGENGLAAALVIGWATDLLPIADGSPPKLGSFDETIGRIRSPEHAAWLLSQPEPSPEQLSELLTVLRNALPNVRNRFRHSAKAGPQFRHGGRPKELDDPDLQRRICEEIKSLRSPRTRLDDLFRRMAGKHGVSATTIKRIWLKCNSATNQQ
jgi:hypothetical protein